MYLQVVPHQFGILKSRSGGLGQLFLAPNGTGCGLHRSTIITCWPIAGVQCTNELSQKLSELLWVLLIRHQLAEFFPLFALAVRKHVNSYARALPILVSRWKSLPSWWLKHQFSEDWRKSRTKILLGRNFPTACTVSSGLLDCASILRPRREPFIANLC